MLFALPELDRSTFLDGLQSLVDCISCLILQGCASTHIMHVFSLGGSTSQVDPGRVDSIWSTDLENATLALCKRQPSLFIQGFWLGKAFERSYIFFSDI